jgi:hypothetical protein
MREGLSPRRYAQATEGPGQAARAWSDLRREQIEPSRVEVLANVSKTAVYRLQGAGPDGSAVIAKACRPAIFAIERVVYEQVLPRLALSKLQYYGSVEGKGDENGWLFLEDMGGEPYSGSVATHWSLAAEWLGTLHGDASRAGVEDLLPDRGPGYYLERLRSGRALILPWLGNNALAADDVAELRRVLSRCDVLESRWSEVTEMCGRMPRTLTHGDFQRKNVRIRSDGTHPSFLIVDWEMAGWGVPAVDLGGGRDLVAGTANAPSEPFLAVYRSVARQTWPSLSAADVRQMAIVGAVFRLLDAIEWASMVLPHHSARAIRNMQIYESMLSDLSQMLGWERA